MESRHFTSLGWQARLIVKRLQTQKTPERRTDAETPVRKSQGGTTESKTDPNARGSKTREVVKL